MRPTILAALACLTVLSLGCSRSEPPDPQIPRDDSPANLPGDRPVQLRGSLVFTSEQAKTEGNDRQGMNYSRRFSASCEFTQPAVTWIDPETGAPQFQLTESEPGVLASQTSGTSEAVGDSRLVDLEHEPKLRETSTVRLRGPVTSCLIRRLDTAQFGQGHDIQLEFQVALTGTARTTTQIDEATQVKPSGGQALPMVLAPEPTEPGAIYALEHDPANTGMHLHASPLLLRPDLGARPEGTDAESQLQQQVYDALVRFPNTAWLGLRLDADEQVWTFEGAHDTGAGERHTVKVRIGVELN